MPFPGYPLSDDFTNDTEVENIHPAHHNALSVAVNALQEAVDDLEAGGGGGGADGREIELQTTATHIQWRYVDTPAEPWTDLLELADLAGPPGDTGAEVELRIDAGWFQWKLTTDVGWSNLLELDTLSDAVAAGLSKTLDIHWETSDDFDLLDLVPHTTDDGVDEWTLSITQAGVASASGGTGGRTHRGRFTGPGPGALDGANSRLFYVAKTSEIPPSIGGRVRQVWWDHSGGGQPNGQGGNVHALRSIGGGLFTAIVVWHDIFVSNPRVINFNVWTTESAPGAGDSVTSITGGVNWNFAPVMDAAQSYNILRSWKNGATTYVQVAEYNHGLIVGDKINVYGPTHLITFGEATITSVSGPTIGFVSIATRNSMAGGQGIVQKGGTQAPFPMVLDSFLTSDGATVHARVYPLRTNQAPPDWGDERYATRWAVPSGAEVATPGQHGICVNHLGLDKFHEIATLTIESRP